MIFKMLDESADKFYKSFRQDDILEEYCAFSCYIQDTFIRSSYVIDTGNFESVNKVMVDRFEWVRKHHPILWRVATWILSL